MSERSYLSIGDVLSLLREEFPDITISKIRFLESRGLLVPERTPSGYRKFYDHDVERLRWILRQQREHFLPLKVIKGRLEGAEASSQPESLFDTGEQPPDDVSGPARSALASMSGPNGTTHPSAAQRQESRVATMERDEEEELPSAASPEPAEPAVLPPEAEPQVPALVSQATTPAPSVSAQPAQPEEVAALAGASFTASEIASAAGIAVAQVEELDSYGLIAGRTVAGVHYYDEDAVVVARLSAGFSVYGIEARHLRIFKHAAERQAGLYSQIVTPLLRQRNPAARAKVGDDLVKLGELGASLQRSFLADALKGLTGR